MSRPGGTEVGRGALRAAAIYALVLLAAVVIVASVLAFSALIGAMLA
jgi:hypothetical protein